MTALQEFDPWAGKQLGEAAQPEGFDEFWRQHERVAQGGRSDFLAKQEALIHSEEVRLEEQSHSRGRGRGRGRGKGRFQRYAHVEPRAPRARPTHFVAIRLYSRMIRRNVQQMQRWFVDKDSLFEKCAVPIKKLHSSLLLTSIPPNRRGEAQEACNDAGQEIREFLGDQPVKLTCSGVGTFNGQVLFTRLRTEPHEMLQAIHDALSRCFMRYGFPVLDESAKSWLEEGDEPHNFKAHASFIKVSKALAHANDGEKHKLRQLRVTADDIEAWRDVFFGAQLCHEFELLDMVGSSRDGYYPCIQMERFNDRPVAAYNSPSHIPLAAGPLRTGRLRVESGEAGAGMEISACPAGYLVEKLLDWPGQPDIQEGDVIVSIGNSTLLELQESELEQKFAKEFQNDALVLVGKLDIIKKMPQSWVCKAIERLIRPWQRSRGEGDDADTVSLYTEGGTRLKGLRYQLRTAAPSFAPDPLSQPGGDPWAKAAEEGYAYPEYTGWGTKFEKNHATRVDSSYFLNKVRVAGPCLDARALRHGGKGEENTRLHQRLSRELRALCSHVTVLEFAHNNRNFMSTSNRELALSRLAACGWLPEDLRAGQQVQALLEDIQEDIDGVEEAQAALSPYLLSNLAYALGKLGLRRPELFRALAGVVRRIGLWTFSEQEVTLLLEGFSRSKLTDEVIFQEASRLVVARIKTIAPRQLTTMLTAFACSNIGTELLFFAAGDAVLESQRYYTTGLLAELADAFSRVRARHKLLLEVVPKKLHQDCMMDRRVCSIQALVKLFSAYCDVREDFGPEGYREDLALAICKRKQELSSRLMRQLLQAAARARWPNATLIDLAAEVALRDPKKWEIAAMCECFDQLHVLPPDRFPVDPEREKLTMEKEHRRLQKRQESFALMERRELPQDSPPKLREGRLCVREGVGAGVEMFPCEAGYVVDEVSATPGQPDLSAGDVILAIAGNMLIGLAEDEVETQFGAGFADGALLIIGVHVEIEQVPLDEVRRHAEALLPKQHKAKAEGSVAAPLKGSNSGEKVNHIEMQPKSHYVRACATRSQTKRADAPSASYYTDQPATTLACNPQPSSGAQAQTHGALEGNRVVSRNQTRKSERQPHAVNIRRVWKAKSSNS